jgi:excisionase family DNA binding protein
MTNSTEVAPLAYTRAQAAEAISVSLRTIDKLLAVKELRCVRIGKAVRIPADSLRAFLRKDHRTKAEDCELCDAKLAA